MSRYPPASLPAFDHLSSDAAVDCDRINEDAVHVSVNVQLSGGSVKVLERTRFALRVSETATIAGSWLLQRGQIRYQN